MLKNLEAASGIEPPKKVLQTFALATWLRRHKIDWLESLVILRRLEDEKIRRLEAEFACVHFH